MEKRTLQFAMMAKAVMIGLMLCMMEKMNVKAQSNHSYVDLGLPSGSLWATCNVGANSPEEYGDYFAWGETEPKDYYDWSTYQYCNGSNTTLTKYCDNSSYGYNGFIDNLAVLLPEDDAATANWGMDWRMPTKQEWEELYNNTTNTWTILNGVNGRIFTASNGNTLFLPAAGFRYENGLYYTSTDGDYWSSLLYTGYPDGAKLNQFTSNYYSIDYSGNRYYGRSVRAVRSSTQNTPPEGAINGLFSVSDTLQVYFSQGNLQYQANSETWRFAENQWDFVGTQNPNVGYAGGTVIGSDNSNIAPTYSGWIDLFGWGTSGYNHGAVCYQPWSTSGNSEDYYAYGNSQYNLNDQTGQADWGYNSISNGGNHINQWRTLTQQEWDYVFNIRTTDSGIRYVKANVNDVNGVILFPDNWSNITYFWNSINTSEASYISNIISSSQWTIFEDAGAVFLPAAGYRNGTSVSNLGNYGIYWSASCHDNNNVFVVVFDNGYFGASLNSARFSGRSIRLVYSAQTVTSYSIEATPNPAEGGTVTGAGIYEESQTCTLTATANEGYAFVKWMENNEEVSTDFIYSFEVTSDRTLVANFEEVVSTAEQTFNLSAGWNWCSFYVDINLDDLKSALVETLPGTSITISSQTQSTVYNGSVWRGQLSTLDVAMMYKIMVTQGCELTLEGMPVNAAEHPVTISNGYNWIAYPLSQSMSLSNAFAGFAVSGDVVSSQTQNATYNGTIWRGTLGSGVLESGKGYKYHSNATEARTFTYPSAK